MRRAASILGAALAVGIVVGGAGLLRRDGGTPVSSSSPSPSSPQPPWSPQPPSSGATPVPDAAESSPASAPTSARRPSPAPSRAGPLAAFLGTYRWEEQPEVDGATPWRRHELFLTTLSADGRSAIGSLVTEGHDRGEVWPVIARSTGPKRVEVVFDTTHPTAGPMPHTPYRNGDRLFTLSGSHGSPTTSLDALATLHRHPAMGRYFTPIGPGDLTGATPSGS